MGTGSSGLIEGGLIAHREENREHPDSGMGESNTKTDFDFFKDANNVTLKLAKEKYEQYNELRKRYSELKERNKEITAENESLRQRYDF